MCKNKTVWIALIIIAKSETVSKVEKENKFNLFTKIYFPKIILSNHEISSHSSIF